MAFSELSTGTRGDGSYHRTDHFTFWHVLKPQEQPNKDWTDYFVAVVNGFLIFATAAGGTNIAGRQQARARARGIDDLDKGAPSSARRSFLTPWF